MSDTIHGHVDAVAKENSGDELMATPAANATTLIVGDVSDFDEDGGHLLLNEVIYTYATVDDDTDTISGISPPVPSAAVGDRVDVWNPATEEVVAEWVATITDDTDSSSFQAPIAHSLVSLLSSGVRGLVGESVVCTRDATGEWLVTQLVGEPPVTQTPTQPISIRSRSAPQQILSNVWTKLVLGETIEQSVIRWPDSDGWVVDRDGIYLPAVSVKFTADGSTGRRGLRLVRNDGFMVGQQIVPPVGGDTALHVSGLVRLLAGQRVAIEVFQNSGAPVDVANDVRAGIYLLG